MGMGEKPVSLLPPLKEKNRWKFQGKKKNLLIFRLFLNINYIVSLFPQRVKIATTAWIRQKTQAIFHHFWHYFLIFLKNMKFLSPGCLENVSIFSDFSRNSLCCKFKQMTLAEYFVITDYYITEFCYHIYSIFIQ